MSGAARSGPSLPRPNADTTDPRIVAGGTRDPNEQVEERLLRPTVSVDIAAQLLGISRASAFRAVHRGQLPAIRLGRRIVIPTSELRHLLHLPATTEA
jgi:excisionase family DNA binding protein